MPLTVMVEAPVKAVPPVLINVKFCAAAETAAHLTPFVAPLSAVKTWSLVPTAKRAAVSAALQQSNHL